MNEGVGRRRSRREREDGKTEAEKGGGQDGDSGRDCLGQTEYRCSVTGYRGTGSLEATGTEPDM